MAILKKHTSAYFTNDLIFDTLINIMQIPFPILEETNSLADKNYKNTSTNLKTLYGKKFLVKIHLLIKVNTEKRPQIACERFSFMIQSILFVFDFASLTSRLKRCFFVCFITFAAILPVLLWKVHTGIFQL